MTTAPPGAVTDGGRAGTGDPPRRPPARPRHPGPRARPARWSPPGRLFRIRTPGAP